MSLGDQLERFKGIGPGFDHLRVGLSISILAWHSFGASYGPVWIETNTPGFVLAFLATLLPMFFGLSGFLIMGSAFRTHNVRTFITFRALRILPALIVEVSLAAIILGPLVTTIPLWEYFTDRQFFAYFGSLIGWIKYFLPGVFLNNPVTTVNGALWTVGPEIVCYCIVAALMLTGLFVRKIPMVLCTAAYFAFCVITDEWDKTSNLVHLPIKALILSFLAGNLMYLYRYKIPYRFSLFLAVVVLSVIAIVLAQGASRLTFFFYIAAILMPYCSAFIGLSDLKPLPLFNKGDYSYGIYIYGFPIQQTITHYFPHMRTWWFNLGVSLPLTLMFAVMSWHLIEKPALSLRKKMLANSSDLVKDEVQTRFDRRKLGILAAVILYGCFVTYVAGVFPLKQMYFTLIGGTMSDDGVKIERF